MIRLYPVVFLLFVSAQVLAQKDSLRTKHLKEVIVESQRVFDIDRLPKVQGTYLWNGKKSEVIQVQRLDANIAEKTPRQIFAKVPGVFVYDMDGTGNQTNISTRGLDAHRGWEFNIRKNGIITNSDMYGYPASHYSMPMEAVERIEIVRGTGSLQYGAQFGGMLNYVSKRPDTTRAVSFESINTIGSFNMLSTYSAISGKVGKFQYYAYYNKRVSKRLPARQSYRLRCAIGYADLYAVVIGAPQGRGSAFELCLPDTRSVNRQHVPCRSAAVYTLAQLFQS